MILYRGLYLLLPAFLAGGLSAQTLPERLRALPGVTSVAAGKGDSVFTSWFDVEFTQPVDHGKPDGPTFRQRVHLSHRETAQPVVLVTEGYAMGSRRSTELAQYLRANQIIVEHRYFGTSRPDSLQWQHLTVKQAADDVHRVATALRTVYPGPWVSTGISKGGQTTLYYRYFYPDDVTASVAYVAPMNIAQEDPRVLTFLRSVGTAACRDRIARYQRSMLKDETRALPLLEQHARQKNLRMSLGTATVYEYMVLEYSFSFWQWGRVPCDSIPDSTAALEDRFRHLVRVIPPNDYTDGGMETYWPFFYQAYTEIGYYGYDISGFRGLLRAVSEPTNRVLAPPGVPLMYRCSTLQAIVPWLQHRGNNIVYLYGENDPWTASAVPPAGTTNCLTIINPGGSHTTRISNLPAAQRSLVLATLSSWLGVTVQDR